MTPLKIAGLDISRGSVTVAILDQLPTEALKSFVKRTSVLKFETTEIHRLLELDFDAAVMEPTGGHYSRLWAERIKASKREVRWVGHREVKGYRESWRLPDKTDKTDAIALACYGLERWHDLSYFLDARIEKTQQLRELYLQLQFLNKAATPLINRLRQQLAWECPELAQNAVQRHWLGNAAGMWRAIAGAPTPRWEVKLSNTVGSGIGAFSRSLANQIVLNELEQMRIETEIALVLKQPEFERYLNAFDCFAFGPRIGTALLTAIYPIEKFHGHRNPLGAFKLTCGMAQVWVQSGEYTGWVAGGDKEIRKALWLWARNTCTPRQEHKSQTPELALLRDYYLNGTEIIEDGELKHLDPGKGSQRFMRVARRAITMLYRKLK